MAVNGGGVEMATGISNGSNRKKKQQDLTTVVGKCLIIGLPNSKIKQNKKQNNTHTLPDI